MDEEIGEVSIISLVSCGETPSFSFPCDVEVRDGDEGVADDGK